MNTIFTILASFSVVPLSLFWGGWVLMRLWAWFLVPAFQVPALDYPVAMGIALIVQMLTYPPRQVDGTLRVDSTVILANAFYAITVPAIALALGWIVKGFL